jgi:hypothetical protein
MSNSSKPSSARELLGELFTGLGQLIDMRMNEVRASGTKVYSSSLEFLCLLQEHVKGWKIRDQDLLERKSLLATLWTDEFSGARLIVVFHGTRKTGRTEKSYFPVFFVSLAEGQEPLEVAASIIEGKLEEQHSEEAYPRAA